MTTVALRKRRLGRLERPALAGVLVREIINFSSYWRSIVFSSTVEPTIYLLAFGFGFGALVTQVDGLDYIEEAERLADTVTIMSHGKAVATGTPRDLITEHAGAEAVEVYGPPARLAEVEADMRAAGLATRRTGTSVAVLRLNGSAPDGERRPANLEDVFVLLTGEEIA